jgi:hypothetical protein
MRTLYLSMILCVDVFALFILQMSQSEQSILDLACIVVPYWICDLECFESDRASVDLVVFLLSPESFVHLGIGRVCMYSHPGRIILG